MKSFAPIDNANSSISATTSSAAAALKRVPTGRFQLRLANTGTAAAFLRWGTSAVTAAVTDYPIPAGAVEVVTIENTNASPITHVAAITASGAATIGLTIGHGI
ncbi:hypothetical protein [Phenylobacterium sp.]|uniref:hypothetical protein n=1 Tax=Phenylobacterium sp. TaxID=1871053 RepID=UPI0026197E4A|nr:hypothetical protein [Phenylobacterium sp.]